MGVGKQFEWTVSCGGLSYELASAKCKAVAPSAVAVTATGLLPTDDCDAASSRMSADIMRDGEFAFDTLYLTFPG
jgi:hypothetical protein